MCYRTKVLNQLTETATKEFGLPKTEAEGWANAYLSGAEFQKYEINVLVEAFRSWYTGE